MKIYAIVVNSNGHAYLESLWFDEQKATDELEYLQSIEDHEDDEFTLTVQDVQE
jgi:hypothetical protein